MFSLKKSSESLWSNAHVTWKTEVQGINSGLTCSDVNGQQLGCSQAGVLPWEEGSWNYFQISENIPRPKGRGGRARSRMKQGQSRVSIRLKHQHVE